MPYTFTLFGVAKMSLAAPASPRMPTSPRIGTSSGSRHHRTPSGTLLGNFINSAAAVFTSPKVSQGPLFLEEEAKMADEALLNGEMGEVKRVELKIGGMTVSSAKATEV